MTDDTPAPPPTSLPPIVDQASLEEAWRTLMEPLGFAAPQLWVMLMDRGRVLQLIKIEEIPAWPRPEEARGLLDLLDRAASGAEVAFLRARPGAERSPADTAWARMLAGAPGGWHFHVANDVELRPITPDDLAVAG